MSLDAVKNFAIVEVSTTYDADDITIVLTSGEGSKLPNPSVDGEFNLVWWNSSLYNAQHLDSNVEIVRCTDRSDDTLTITRAQESTPATAKNTTGCTYSMALVATAKMITDIDTLKANTASPTFTGFIKKSTTNGITAYAGGGQNNAITLISDINEISVSATHGDSVKLPIAVAGMEIIVINNGSSTIDIFPASGNYINNGTINTAINILMDATAICYCYIADYWKIVEVRY